MKCPFKTTENFDEIRKKADSILGKSFQTCPYLNTGSTIDNSQKISFQNEKKEEMEKNSDDELEMGKGGCPVMNKRKFTEFINLAKRDPLSKHFDFFFEIGYHRPMDFIFKFHGGIPSKEFDEKTSTISGYPKHLLYTLFHTNEKLVKMRQKEFPEAFFAYNELKEKGNKLCQSKKYREAIEYYYMVSNLIMFKSYSVLKWLEFVDEKKKEKILKDRGMEAILDCDVEVKKVFIDEDNSSRLFDSYEACLVFLLLNLSSVYMELRHYSEALKCLDECEAICGDKIADVFFRRSQVRTYNRSSDFKELYLALNDIEKAKRLKDEKIYEEHLNILLNLIENKKKSEIEKLTDFVEKAKYAVEKIYKNKMNIHEVIFDGNLESYEMQNKILDEMKINYESAMKFYTEENNAKQLELAYVEIEKFMKTYTDYKSYYNLELSRKNEFYENISQENIKLLEDFNIIRYANYLKNRKCEEIFSEGKFNFPLFQHCLNKVSSEMRAFKKTQQSSLHSSLTLSWISNSKLGSKGYFYFLLFSVLIFSISIMFFAKYYTNSFPKVQK